MCGRARSLLFCFALAAAVSGVAKTDSAPAIEAGKVLGQMVEVGENANRAAVAEAGPCVRTRTYAPTAQH